jgi:hypothetical protein
MSQTRPLAAILADVAVSQPAAAGNCGSCCFNRSKSTGLVMNSEAPSSRARRRLSSSPGGNHHDGQIGTTLFDFPEQFETVLTRHVDVREHRREGWFDFRRKPIQSLFSRTGEMHNVLALTSFSTEPLPEQVGHIGLIVHDQETHAHDAASPKSFDACGAIGR